MFFKLSMFFRAEKCTGWAEPRLVPTSCWGMAKLWNKKGWKHKAWCSPVFANTRYIPVKGDIEVSVHLRSGWHTTEVWTWGWMPSTCSDTFWTNSNIQRTHTSVAALRLQGFRLSLPVQNLLILATVFAISSCVKACKYPRRHLNDCQSKMGISSKFLAGPGSAVLDWEGNQCLQHVGVHKSRLFPDYWPDISPGPCNFWKSLSCSSES